MSEPSDDGIGEYYERQRVRAIAARAALKVAQDLYDLAVEEGASQNMMNRLAQKLRHARIELDDALYVGD